MDYKIGTKDKLETFILENWFEVDRYLREQRAGQDIPFYSSVDIREGHNKIAPVDHNVYPAGFNNLCEQDLKLSGQKMLQLIKGISSGINHVAILPESHTKNIFYLDHLEALKKIMEDVGFAVSIITFDEAVMEGKDTVELLPHSKRPLHYHRAVIKDDRIMLPGKKDPKESLPDLMVLNNDQSNPLELPWNQLKTPVVPSPHMGWNNRQKINHFLWYKRVADDFCQHFNINPNLIQAKFRYLHDIDFSLKVGLDRMAHEVDELIKELPQKSKVFIKANQGTYGMGIMVVSSGEELISLNRKTRNKMDVGKNNKKFTSFLIQEGIETVLKFDGMPAEVAIYLLGGESVGGFQRVHPMKDAESNLNSPGMVFQKFCITELKNAPLEKKKEMLYSVLAQLATIASAHESKEELT